MVAANGLGSGEAVTCLALLSKLAFTLSINRYKTSKKRTELGILLEYLTNYSRRIYYSNAHTSQPSNQKIHNFFQSTQKTTQVPRKLIEKRAMSSIIPFLTALIPSQTQNLEKAENR